MNKPLKAAIILLLAVLLLVVIFFTMLTLNEYRPAPVTELEVTAANGSLAITEGSPFRVVTFNTGYAALGDNADFFMDGGKSVISSDKLRVEQNLGYINGYLPRTGADAVFLQEVDVDAVRSYGIDQFESYSPLYASSVYACNYKCIFVPYPIPPIGAVDSGIASFSKCYISSAKRVSLPEGFYWPVSTANLKRCLLVSYIPLEESDKQLVLINFHLEAFDNGSAKIAQTQALLKVLEEEYANGNYVIAGGDFNQTLPGGYDVYPIFDTKNWIPGDLDGSILPEGWSFAYDSSTPTCRSLAAPYVEGESQTYLIDGFIYSPNIELVSVKTDDLGFVWSDHNPVIADFILK